MIKAGDRIVFKRTKYGEYKTGVFLGERKVENAKSGEPDRMYRVKLESGEEIEFNFCDKWTLDDAKSYMHNHIGWLTVKEDFTHRDEGYECAAWYEDIAVKKGSRYPLYADELKGGDIHYVHSYVEGEVTSDDFGSRFGGVPISNYDNKKNAGKHSQHYLTWYGYEFGSQVLGQRGCVHYVEKASKVYEFEVFDSFAIEGSSFDSSSLIGGERYKIYTSRVHLDRFVDQEDALRAELESKGLSSDLTFAAGVYQLEFVWGDWKEHIVADNTVREFFEARGIEVTMDEEITDSDGSDTYSSVHTYSRV